MDFGPSRLVTVVVDGGGSSTLVIENERGKTEVLNSPIDSHIPRREHPVANHLGVYVDQ